jgi:hypothetical protein
MARQPQRAAGVVEIRLSGDIADLDALTARLAGMPGVEILSQSAGYPNRRDPGERVYLTARLTVPGPPAGGAS